MDAALRSKVHGGFVSGLVLTVSGRGEVTEVVHQIRGNIHNNGLATFWNVQTSFNCWPGNEVVQGAQHAVKILDAHQVTAVVGANQVSHHKGVGT